MVCAQIQSITDRGSVLHVGGGVLQLGNAANGDQYDPENATAWTIVPIPPRPNVSIADLGGGWKEISAESPFGASNSDPANGATDVVRDVVLGWTPAVAAVSHDVYLGTDRASVTNASRNDPMDVLVALDLEPSAFDPGLLRYGQTYYWRVDEVNEADPASPWQGEVWSFTVEPYSYPIENVTATASSAQPDMGPGKTVDGSGLNNADEHSSMAEDMWLSADTLPNWIQYRFDKPYVLDQIWVWNSNQAIESIIGFGARDVKIEYSLDGDAWTELAGVPEFARAAAKDTYTHNTVVSFGRVSAQYVKLTINSTWGGMTTTGLSEVRFLHVPMQAREPSPGDMATHVSLDAVLNWRPGRQAVSHRVYFGTDRQAVTDGMVSAKTLDDHSYSPSSLQLDTTYYWRVDEVNEVAAPSSWPGDVWTFTTQAYGVLDDFEGYTDDDGNRIYQAWADGWGTTTNGSQVGHTEAPFAEQTVVHGGWQSMPLSYSNTGTIAVSEATRSFDAPQNWVGSGAKSLSLYFQGAPGNGGQLYVKINNTKVPYNGNAADISTTAWLLWHVDLSAVSGNLTSVSKLTIGIEGSGAQGIVYIDDIRLYPKAPEYITPADPGKTNLVALYAFEGNANDTSGHGLNGTLKQATLVNSGRPNGGSAVQLNRVGHVDLGNPAALNFGTGNWTVTAWFKTAITGSGDANKGTIYAKGGDGAGGHRYTLAIGEVASGIVSLTCDDDVTKVVANSTSMTNDDQWHFVAGQRDGTAIRILIDGRLEGTATVAANYSLSGASQHNGYIGAITNHGDGSLYKLFNGLIDDVRLYNRAIFTEEILWLSGQTTPVAKPL